MAGRIAELSMVEVGLAVAADEVGTAVDRVWAVLRECVAWASAREWTSRSGDQPALESSGPIEVRLAEHVDVLQRGELGAILEGGDVESDLALLAGIAERHFAGALDPVVGLLLFRPFWRRQLSEWSRPVGGVLCSLVSHLFVEFPTPHFLLRWWSSANAEQFRWMTWVIAMAQGGSVRRMAWRTTGKPPSPKFLAALARVPAELAPDHGIVYAEVLRLRGTALEFERLIGSPRFILDPTSGTVGAGALEFWAGAVRWLIRHREALLDEDCGEILAWARHLYRLTPNRSFDWSGRTPDSLLRDARLHNMSRSAAGQLEWTPRRWDWSGEFHDKQWSIDELTTSRALHTEAQAMAHCVWTYDGACAQGRSAIFRLRQAGTRRVTVEIEPGTKRLVQAKRAFNRQPSDEELSVIAYWHRMVVSVERG